MYDAELARARRARRLSRELEPEPLIPPQRHTGRRAVQNPLYSPPSFPLFHEILDRIGDDFEPWTSSRSSRDQEIHIEINLTWEQARRGGNVRVWLPVQVICPACRGQGQDWFFRCSHCRGSGTIEKELPLPISFPARVSNGTIGRLPLDQFGIHHTSLIVHFRVRW
jgi:hypothetical protein